MALLRGTLDVLVLKTLSWSAMHAFEIVSWLEDRSGGKLDIQDAALLQSLHRLEERELIEAEWGVTRNDRKARYYRLTSSGRTKLREDTAQLRDDVGVLTTILAAKKTAT